MRETVLGDTPARSATCCKVTTPVWLAAAARGLRRVAGGELIAAVYVRVGDAG
jgi:hypothetical protein